MAGSISSYYSSDSGGQGEKSSRASLDLKSNAYIPKSSSLYGSSSFCSENQTYISHAPSASEVTTT